ncbi:MAG: hypothetical protein ABIH63_04365 [archaeon]
MTIDDNFEEFRTFVWREILPSFAKLPNGEPMKGADRHECQKGIFFTKKYGELTQRIIYINETYGYSFDIDQIREKFEQLEAKKDKFLTSEEQQPKNPFRNLHYATTHLPYYKHIDQLLGLYGKHYNPIKKARYYQLAGGIIQRPIKLGMKYTDTRFPCGYSLPTEGGKNDIIYLFKDIVTKTKKTEQHFYTIEEPVSYHPEQLVGKVITTEINNPKVLSGEATKPKKIRVKVENRGHFDADYVDLDEANTLIFQNDEQTKQAREYISKALNPIGRNEITKRLVDDLPAEKISYDPVCTFSFYFQPAKIPENLVLQGFLRRNLMPVGKIEPFLNYGNEEDFKNKITDPNFSRQETRDQIIKHLEKVRESTKGKDFAFTDGAKEKINYYLPYLIAEGQVHSEKVANYTKLVKWTIQDYLIKMSCILAGSYYTTLVTEDFVTLAFMDLVELLQATFDFIKEWVIGDFSYGVGWQGANYKERNCLEYLYEKKCFSLETSTISISDFQRYITNIYAVKEDMARKICNRFKKNRWIDSKQIDRYETRVWLTFIPQVENLTFQGDKGNKGSNLYESVFSSINDILKRVSPLPSFPPSIKEEEVDDGNS